MFKTTGYIGIAVQNHSGSLALKVRRFSLQGSRTRSDSGGIAHALSSRRSRSCLATQRAWESGLTAARDGFPKASALAERALELDPNLAQAHTRLA
jgi:hypothetical protein